MVSYALEAVVSFLFHLGNTQSKEVSSLTGNCKMRSLYWGCDNVRDMIAYSPVSFWFSGGNCCLIPFYWLFLPSLQLRELESLGRVIGTGDL